MKRKKIPAFLAMASVILFYVIYMFLGVSMCAKEHTEIFKNYCIVVGIIAVVITVITLTFFNRLRTVLACSIVILLLTSCCFQSIFSHFFTESFSITDSICDEKNDEYRLTKKYYCSYCGKEKAVEVALKKEEKTDEDDSIYFSEGENLYHYDPEIASFVVTNKAAESFTVKAIPSLIKQTLGAPVVSLLEQLTLAVLMSFVLLISLKYLLPESQNAISRFALKHGNADAGIIGHLFIIASMCTMIALCAVCTHTFKHLTFFNEIIRLCYLLLTAQIIILQRDGCFEERSKAFFVVINVVPLTILVFSFFLVGETGFAGVTIVTSLIMKLIFFRSATCTAKHYKRYAALCTLMLIAGLVIVSVADFSRFPKTKLLEDLIDFQKMLNGRLQTLFLPVSSKNGYQIIVAQEALSLGGFAGVSMPDILSIPYAENDMIIPYIGLTWGLLGILIVILPLLTFFFIALKTVVNRYNENNTTGLFLSGTIYMMIIQTICQFAGSIGALFTGVGIPFISTGRSSFVVCCSVALLLFFYSFPEYDTPSLAKYIKKRKV